MVRDGRFVWDQCLVDYVGLYVVFIKTYCTGFFGAFNLIRRPIQTVDGVRSVVHRKSR